jgi:class 3 adenylate cyclase
MDIAAWLRGIGLEQYAPAFRDNRIDMRVLPKLTAEDLKDLGITMIGHRRILLEAIAERKSGETHSSAAASTPLPNPPPLAGEGRVGAEAERRQVTVMFCDLVGSTALSARLDPEDLREVIGRYHACVAETVSRCDGFVAKYMGDGVLVYFGYPQAHEDDAEQAVRAGLALLNAAGEIEAPGPLQLRIGIATGLVVVGDLIGAGSAQEQAIVGETPNLASRLQTLAEPNAIVIAESTRRLIGALFELADLGPQPLKGFAGPQRAWRAVSENRALGRFEALRSGTTPLVGREEEIELLLRRWTRAKRGEGQVVLLGGEAGIGKSRLTAALIDRVAGEPHMRLRYFCSPQHTDSALYPIIGQMERGALLAHDDTPGAKLDKLDALLAPSSTSPEDAGLLAEMLSLANDGRYPILALPPEQRRQRTLAALLAQVEALARQCPVLIIFEDAHWSDPTSLEALGRTIDRIANLRVLVIVTFRPEYAPPWIGQAQVTLLTLNRLAVGEAGTLVDRIAANHALPAGVRREIIERTDGIPLFVEEMTKAVLEAGSERAARDAAASVPLTAIAVPASLHASLMARLDRLGAAKRVAQIGSVIGREFSHALLAAVARDVPVQTRPGAGRRLWHAAPRGAAGAACACRRHSRATVRGDRRTPAGAARAALRGGGPHRKGRASVGKGRAAIDRALGAGRSHRADLARPRPDCNAAVDDCTAARTAQLAGRADHPSRSRQGVALSGNQGGGGAGKAADRAGAGARRGARRSASAVCRLVRDLGDVLRGVRWRHGTPARRPVSLARRKTGRRRPAPDRAPNFG